MLLYKEVARRDCKNNSYTFKDLQIWAQDHLPEGYSINDDNVKISFEVEQYNGYYDESIIDVYMILYIM